MDWKGYGIVQQCGTCEPQQSPTSSSRMISDVTEEKAELMLRVRDVILPHSPLEGRAGERFQRF